MTKPKKVIKNVVTLLRMLYSRIRIVNVFATQSRLSAT